MTLLDINRRQALKALIASVGGSVGLTACTQQAAVVAPSGAHQFYSLNEFQALSTIAELIIPETDTPGAISAGVPQFLDGLMAVWASQSTQIEHRAQLSGLIEQLGGHTILADTAIAEARLTRLDAAAFTPDAAEYTGYRRIKRLIVDGYFTSEAGATQERIWIPVPGRWDPAVPIQAGADHV